MHLVSPLQLPTTVRRKSHFLGHLTEQKTGVSEPLIGAEMVLEYSNDGSPLQPKLAPLHHRRLKVLAARQFFGLTGDGLKTLERPALL